MDMDRAGVETRARALYLMWVVQQHGPFQSRLQWYAKAGNKAASGRGWLDQYAMGLEQAGYIERTPIKLTPKGLAWLKKDEALVPSALPAKTPRNKRGTGNRPHRVVVTQHEGMDYDKLAGSLLVAVVQRLQEPVQAPEDKGKVKELQKALKSTETALRASEGNLAKLVKLVEQLTKENETLKDSLQKSGEVRALELLSPESKAALDKAMRQMPS